MFYGYRLICGLLFHLCRLKVLKAAKKDIIKQVARNNGVSEEEVREMKAAMMAGWNNSDPKVREIWSRIPCEGEMPIPEELIIWTAIQVTTKDKE